MCATALDRSFALTAAARAAEGSTAHDEDAPAAGVQRTSGKILNKGTREAEVEIAPPPTRGGEKGT